ncbi:uncharacterized protein METZ01_LOCUS502331, partial [marine metagenome]
VKKRSQNPLGKFIQIILPIRIFAPKVKDDRGEYQGDEKTYQD